MKVVEVGDRKLDLESVTFQALDPITRDSVASWELPYDVALEGFRVDVPASEVGVVVRAVAPGAWSPSVYVPPEGALEPLFLVPERRVVLRVRSSHRALERLAHEDLYVLGRVWAPGKRLPPGLYRGPCDGEWADREREFIVTCPFAAGETTRLRVWMGLFQAWRTTLTDSSEDLSFELNEPRTGATVSGRLSGSPAAVYLVGDDGRIPVTTWADATGSFKLEGLSPGRFSLRLVDSPLDRWPVRIESLDDWIDVGDLQSAASNLLTVELRGAQGASLTGLAVTATAVELDNEDQVVSYGSEPIAGAPSEGGLFTWDGLPQGHYELEVSSQQGDRYHQESIRFLGTDYTVLELALLPVKGILRRGGDVVEGAMLWFGGMWGVQRVAMRSREGGVFRGLLPREGEWYTELTAAPECDPCEGSWEGGWEGHNPETVEHVGFIEAEADDDGVARIEIDLAAGRVNGRVVAFEEDVLRGVKGARVKIERAQKTFTKGSLSIGPWVTRSEGASGGFTVVGLPAGRFLASAELLDGGGVMLASGHIQFRVDDGLSPPELELRLQQKQQIRVAVRSDGAPVSRAAAWVRSGSAVDGKSPMSLDGQGVFWLPAPVSDVDVFVWAKEFGAAGVRQKTTPDGAIAVELARYRGDLRLPRRLGGRLVTESGAAIGLDELRTLARHAVLDDGDEVVVRDLSPGSYLWCPSYDEACVPATVVPWTENQVGQ
ncbi:MAG: carboxypeptidase-like regulatory domain-containing protein [Acidobacteria bacterium]|nr:carboxypeptidase-like regulatory domain-containing protein [Acidobacteriota bacterium]